MPVYVMSMALRTLKNHLESSLNNVYDTNWLSVAGHG